jgi:hypothetical protein
MDEVSKILTPKKKDQSANTKPPTEIFPLSLRKIADMKGCRQA